MTTAKVSKSKARSGKGATAGAAGKVRVTLVGSPFGTGKQHIACVRGLGLRRMRDTRELEDTPAVRGMIARVSYLVKAEKVG
jgi:large subunit ribosomal protein L30